RMPTVIRFPIVAESVVWLKRATLGVRQQVGQVEGAYHSRYHLAVADGSALNSHKSQRSEGTHPLPRDGTYCVKKLIRDQSLPRGSRYSQVSRTWLTLHLGNVFRERARVQNGVPARNSIH